MICLVMSQYYNNPSASIMLKSKGRGETGIKPVEVFPPEIRREKRTCAFNSKTTWVQRLPINLATNHGRDM